MSGFIIVLSAAWMLLRKVNCDYEVTSCGIGTKFLKTALWTFFELASVAIWGALLISFKEAPLAIVWG